MPIHFHCPHCDRLLRTPDSAAGQKARCPSCGAVVDIPSARPPERPPAAPPPSSPHHEGRQGDSALRPSAGPPPIAPSDGGPQFGPSSAPSDDFANPYRGPHTSPQAPYSPTSGRTGAEGQATAALVLGIVGLLFGITNLFCCLASPISFVSAILAIVFGIPGRQSLYRGQATAGLIMGWITLALSVLWILLFLLAIPFGAILESCVLVKWGEVAYPVEEITPSAAPSGQRNTACRRVRHRMARFRPECLRVRRM